MLEQLTGLYKFGLITILPMLIVLGAIILKQSTMVAMFFSSLVAVFIGTFYQGFEFKQGLTACMTGFNVSMLGVEEEALLPNVVSLLNRGGISNNGSFVAFIFCAMIFAGIVTGTGMMSVAMKQVTLKIRSCGVAVLVAEIECIIINMLTGSDGLNKIITTESLMEKFLELRVHPIVLCRSLEDSGTLTAALVPWSAAGLYMSNTLGVPTMDYFPYCVLVFGSLFFGAFFAFTGFKIVRITDEEAYAMARERGIVLRGMEQETANS